MRLNTARHILTLLQLLLKDTVACYPGATHTLLSLRRDNSVCVCVCLCVELDSPLKIPVGIVLNVPVFREALILAPNESVVLREEWPFLNEHTNTHTEK